MFLNNNGAETPNLRGLSPHPSCKPDLQVDDFQRVTLRRRGDGFYLMCHPADSGFARIWESKSLHYASHSTVLDVSGPSLLQLALAIALKLYPVSRAIKFHREMAGKYLLSLPQGDFVKDLVLPL
jgi:hypothetical protein